MGPGGPSVTQGQMPVAPQPPPTYPSRSPSRPASAARRVPRRSGRSRGHRRTAGELPCCPRRPWNVGRARGGPPVLTNRLPRPRPDQSGVQALAQEPIGRRGGTRACAQHPRRPHEGTTGSAEAAGALMPRLPQFTLQGAPRSFTHFRIAGGPGSGSPRDTIFLHVPRAHFSKTRGKPVPPGATGNPQDRDRTGPWVVPKSGLDA